MPWQQVPSKFKAGQLHSGSKSGPIVKKPSQMRAILMGEKRKGLTEEPDADGAMQQVRKAKPKRTKR